MIQLQRKLNIETVMHDRYVVAFDPAIGEDYAVTNTINIK